MVSLDDIAARISPDPAAPRVVAIDGPSGSGKSTLAARLAARMPTAVVIPSDDFASWADPTGETWWDRFDTQVLTPAFAGQALRYQLRDWDNDEFGTSLAGWRDVPVSRVVIVEGVTCARASVRARQAFTIWIEATAERRLMRGLERDGGNYRARWLHWREAEAAFFADDQTRASADLRVDGDPVEPHDPNMQLIVI